LRKRAHPAKAEKKEDSPAPRQLNYYNGYTKATKKRNFTPGQKPLDFWPNYGIIRAAIEMAD
jgi:hypothetical protein